MKKLLQAFAAMCFTVLFVSAASADLIPFSYSGSGVWVAGTLFAAQQRERIVDDYRD